LSENRAVCVIMWTNIVEPDRPQMTIRGMRIACWIPKATNTRSEHVMLFHGNSGCTNAPQRCVLCVMSACGSRDSDSSLVQCLGYDMNNLCIGVCVSTATRYYYFLQNLQSGCGASPATCAFVHSTWRSCPGSEAAGTRSLPYLHLSPGVENAWTSGSTT
jgi:hypothetical protein